MSKASKNTGKDDPGRLFAEQLIERMKEINASDWKQGWIDAKSNGGIPQNIDGRRYNGANPFFLMMNTAKNKYTVPVYATFLRISKLNDHLLDENGRIPKDKSDQCVRIKKGEHSIPVLYWSFSIKDKDGHKISMEEYDKLTKEEQDKYTVMPIPRTYLVFNIDQTNLAEVDKERYQAIVDKVKGTSLTDTAGMYANAALDRMFAKQEWVCPIHVDEAQPDCFYRTSEDAIYGPMKGQFKTHNEKEPEELYKDGMEFYSSIVHEMAHSTGTAERLNRQKGSRFGDPKYAKEELVAELTAALVGSTLGFDKRIRDNNTAYVKGWLNALHEEPKFIYTIMSEVGKASDMILAEVEKQEKKIEAEQGHLESQEAKTDEKAEQVKDDKVQAVIQHTDDNQRADIQAAKQMPEQQNDTDNEKSIVNLVDGEDSTYYYFFYKFPVLGAKKPSELVGEKFFLDDDQQKALVITGYDKVKDQFTVSEKDAAGKDVTKQMSSDNLTDYLFYHFSSEAQNKVNDLAAERMKAQKAVEESQPLRYHDGKWLGVPADVAVSDLIPNRGREPYSFLKNGNDRIDLIKLQDDLGVARVYITDNHAETPAAILKELENEGFSREIKGNGYSDGFVDFDNFKEADAFASHVDDIQKRVDAERASRTMDVKPAINPKELTDAEVKDFREGLQDTVRRMKNEGDSDLSINNYLDDLKVKWEDSPAMLSAISDAGKMISEEEKKDWYVSVNYLQNSEDTAVFEELESKDDYKGMLQEARNYDFSAENDWDLQDTFKGSPKHYSGDDIMDEDEDYAIVKNDSVGGSYTIFRRATESEVRDEAIRQGFGEEKVGDYASDLSDDVKSLVNQIVDEKQKVVSQSENVKPSQEPAKDWNIPTNLDISDAGKMIPKEEKKDWYVSVNNLQNSEDTAVFEEFEANDDYKGMLQEARNYDFSAENDWDLQDTFRGSPKHYSGDDIMDEDEDYAIVKNDAVGGSFTIFRRATESEVRDEAARQGYGEEKIGDYDNRLSDDLKGLVNQMVDEKQKVVSQSDNVKQSQEPAEDKIRKQLSDNSAQVDPKTAEKSQSEQQEIDKIFSKLTEAGSELQRNYFNNEKFFDKTWYGNHLGMDNVNGIVSSLSYEYSFINNGGPEGNKAKAAFTENFKDAYRYFSELCWIADCKGYGYGAAARGFSPSAPLGIMWNESYNAQRQLDRLNDVLGLNFNLNKLYYEGIEKSRTDFAKAHALDNENPEVEILKHMPETDDSQTQKELYDVIAMKDGNRETIKTGLTMEASAKFVERNDQRYQRKGYDYLISMPQGEQDIKKALSDKIDVMEEPAPSKVPTIQEYFADNKLENGQTVDKLTVLKQDDKSIFYTEVGNLKMSREASKEDLKAFFDRTTPVSDIVAKNFGEQLHLASFYNQFKLAEGVADVNLKHAADGNWYVQAKLTDGRTTDSHVLSWHDRQSLFTIHAATKEQLAARYLNPEIKKMVAEKPIKEQADIQNVSGNMKDSQNAQNTKKWYWDLPGSVELTIPSVDFKYGEKELLQAVHKAYGDDISDIDLQDVHYNLPIGTNRKNMENNMASLLAEDVDAHPLKSYSTLAEDDKFVVVGDTQSKDIRAYRKLSEEEVVKVLTDYAKSNDISIAPMDRELQELASKVNLQEVRSEKEHNMDNQNSATKSDKEKQQEIQDTMETKKEKEAKQKAAEAQKEAQQQKEQEAKQKQAQEQAQQQQQRQQKEQKEKDKSQKPVSAAVAQSALIVTALEFAKANDGRFLNPGGKPEPQIINSKTSLTPYNQAILAMKSDQEGWRTNAYTFMKPAADAGMPVRKGEKATPANWVQWSYKNTQTGEIIDSKKFKDIPESDRDLYERVHERKSYPLFNVDQTVMNAKKHEDYINLVTSKGQTLETIRDFKHDDRAKRTEELMSRLPHSVVLYKDGDTIKAYGGSAKKLQNILSESKGFNITDTKSESGKKLLVASFPESRLASNLKAINAKGERISFLEDKDLATFIKKPIDKSDVIKTVLQDVNKAAQGSGIKVERVLKEAPTEYDAAKDTITYSGISKDDGTLRSVSASLDKANDLYRSLVDAFNSESRLDASHRVNMTPEDAAAHVALVRDMAAGVLMTRHGLPSSLSVDTMNSIDHLINELKENPNKVNLLERGVNSAIEVIDKARLGREIDYGKIRGEKSALADTNSMNFSIIRNLQSMPDKDSREIVVIRDKASSKADVILPQGASLEANNELPGISKSRIANALSKEGINDVKFYNARGGLGLQQPNAYFEGKEVTLSKLKQYDLLTKKELDVSSSIGKSNDKAIEKFRPIKDNAGTYVFYIKPENEKGFGIKPSGKDLTEYYNAVRSKDKQAIYSVVDKMSQKYYRMASNHPDLKRDFIMPDTSKIDFAKVKIENATLTRDKADNQVYLQARVNGKFMREPVTKQQWDRMWLADDMQAYKNAVAAVTFVPKLDEKQAQSTEKSQQANVGTSESESVKTAQADERSEDKSKDRSDTNSLGESTGPSADDSKSAIPEQTENDDQEEDVEEGVRSGRRL